MKKLFVFNLILFLLMISDMSFSQQVVSSAATHATGINVQLSWTVGEPVIETFTGTGVILTQGFHQSTLSVMPVYPGTYTGIKLSVFPNPVKMELNLEISGTGIDVLDYQLFDATGNLLVIKKIEMLQERIHMSAYPPGFYLLRISRNDGELLKTFKILKTEE